MPNKSLAIIAAIAVIGLLFLVYLAATFESPEGTRTVDIAVPAPRVPEPIVRDEPPAAVPTTPIAQTPVAPVLPVVREPVVPEEIIDLPVLNESDAFLTERVQGLETGTRLLSLITPDDVIRKFVVFVDNVADSNLPQLEYPVRRPSQGMAVRELDENLFEMQSVSYQRYTPIVDGLAALSPERALAIYEVMKPLFQEAYREIGYPDRDFDDTLVRAIDTVLNARTAEGPFQLIKPKVMYIYADSEIESLNPVEKQLLRLGPQNAEKLKLTLRQYREQLTAP